MMEYIKMQDLLCGLLNVLYPGIAEFNHLMAIRADQVIVLFVSVGFLVLGQVLAKLMLAHQVTLHQKVQRIVHGRPADPVILVLHADVERLHVKMAVAGIYFLQYGVPFRRLPQGLVFQICCEYLPDLLV